jgi:preprotein translocase SecF subunit
MLRILHNTNIDFIRLTRRTSLVIAAFLLPALVWILVSDFKFGIEFTGGTMAEIHFKEAPNIADVRAAVASAGVGNADIQTFGSPREFVIRAQGSDAVAAQANGAESVMASISAALTERFGAGSFTEVGSEAISATVGDELRGDAVLALLISFAVSLIYLAWRFDWRLSLAAVLANVHDIVATIAFIKYAGIEVNLFVVGGILTVIGYSLNDKVVVFDRVRELLRTAHRVPLRDTLNRAINETLPRTVLTGTTVLATLMSLILLGGDVLRAFALVLFFGIVVGTFSSIYVAGPVLLFIEKRWPRTASGASEARPRSERPRKAKLPDPVSTP